MKSTCCVDAVLRYFGVLFLAPILLMSCADDNNSNAVGPNTQSEISSSSMSSVAESSGNSSSSVSNVSQKGVSKTVYGLAQNGPYADSSVVKLTALDESTLESTEQVFTGMVEGGYGGNLEFSV